MCCRCDDFRLQVRVGSGQFRRPFANAHLQGVMRVPQRLLRLPALEDFGPQGLVGFAQGRGPFLHAFSSASFAWRKATSACSRSRICSRSWPLRASSWAGLGSASAFGTNGTSKLAVASETAAVPALMPPESQ